MIPAGSSALRCPERFAEHVGPLRMAPRHTVPPDLVMMGIVPSAAG
jgi:hypothetical protein